MPWDDDLDVSMPWEKYDAFVETLNTTMVLQQALLLNSGLSRNWLLR